MFNLPPNDKEAFIYSLSLAFIIFGLIAKTLVDASARAMREILIGFFIGIPMGLLGVWVAMGFTENAGLAASAGIICGILGENIIKTIVIQGKDLPEYVAAAIRRFLKIEKG